MHSYDEPYIIRLDGIVPIIPDDAAAASPSEATNCLIHELRRVVWLPPTFVALVLQHQLDFAGILSLSDSELRSYFFIDDVGLCHRIRSYFSLCAQIFETQRRDELEFQGRTSAVGE